MKDQKAGARLRDLVCCFAQNPDVEAVVLSGSAAGGVLDHRSDFDVYVYSREFIPVDFREAMLRPRAQLLEVHRTFWEDEDAWIEHDGSKFEAMYRSCEWTEGELSARWKRYEASVGYTTAVLYTIVRAEILFDRNGWFKSVQEQLSTSYPAQLARAIVQKNFPLLGSVISSYEEQIYAAFERQDLISLNHRVAGWLASYFDILFAGNYTFYPGEKRLLTHARALSSYPDAMSEDLALVCKGAADLRDNVGHHLSNMGECLRTWLHQKTLL